MIRTRWRRVLQREPLIAHTWPAPLEELAEELHLVVFARDKPLVTCVRIAHALHDVQTLERAGLDDWADYALEQARALWATVAGDVEARDYRWPAEIAARARAVIERALA